MDHLEFIARVTLTKERIKAHVFLCALSLLLERVAEKTCGRTWFMIREELRTIKVGQLLGPQGVVYQTSPGSAEARKMLKKLKYVFIHFDCPPSTGLLPTAAKSIEIKS